MIESYCPFKKNYIYPLAIVVGYIGYVLYKKYNTGVETKKNYIAGGISTVDIKCNELNKIIKNFLNKHHEYKDNFKIIKGTQQVVAGIKYNITIEKQNKKEIIINFVYRPWLNDNEIFQNLDISKKIS
jgi:hypothetical protein